MPRCFQCSADLTEDARFCSSCGQPRQENVFGLMNAIGALASVFLVAKLTRRKAAGLLAMALLTIGISLSGHLPIELVLAALFAAMYLPCLMRVGLLAVCVGQFDLFTLADDLVTFDLSRWYAWRGLAEIAVVSALALYGFKVAVAGKPIFGGALED
jgi:hypothetical protein